ncbi:MAG: sulfatase-like hydrolase/transferase [Candidatus Moduliflexus flocculans]|nr:sulfatase-like hydrolase/transferase [Candidatus Moduliflexus flocculans]
MLRLCRGQDAPSRRPGRRGHPVRPGLRAGPLTLPAHATILTGLYPAAHGVRNNGRELDPKFRTLAELLKGQGFATAAFVSSFSVDSRFGLGRGFDVYEDTFQAESPLKGANAERRAEETFARFSRWFDGSLPSPVLRLGPLLRPPSALRSALAL